MQSQIKWVILEESKQTKPPLKLRNVYTSFVYTSCSCTTIESTLYDTIKIKWRKIPILLIENQFVTIYKEESSVEDF